MHGDEHPQKRAFSDSRERVLEGLSVAFSRDELSMDEFEQRVDAAFSAADVTELTNLVADLGVESSSLERPASPTTRAIVSSPVANANYLASHQSLPVASSVPRTLAVFGNVERGGLLVYPAKSKVVCVFGNVELDLRQARLTSPVTEIDVRAVFGNVELVVPPQLMVVCDGIGVFGSFAGLHRVPANGSGTGPLLRITGKAVFGNVEVRTLPVGTTKGTRVHLSLPGRGVR